MNKKKASKVLYNLGILMIISGVFILINNVVSVQASIENYAEHYTISKWRSMKAYNKDNPDSYTSWVTLGPAEWQVKGSIGDSDPLCVAGETCINETWSVGDWDNGENFWEGCFGISFVRYDYLITDARINTSVGSGFSDWGSGDFYWGIYPSGMYGAMVIKPMEACFTSAHSWPIDWNVIGEMTTP